MRNLILLGLCVVMFLMACNDDEDSLAQATIDNQIIKDYLADNNLTADSLRNGVYYVERVEGSGVSPTTSATVTIHYKGYLTDGTVFDSTDGVTPATFPLANLIQGWQIGIPEMKIGGEATLLIPSAAGYGPSGTGSIPGNSVLLFDIELINF